MEAQKIFSQSIKMLFKLNLANLSSELFSWMLQGPNFYVLEENTWTYIKQKTSLLAINDYTQRNSSL